MGLVFRSGWQREFGLGAALGWGMLVASILPLVLSGGLIITFWAIPRQFGILFIDLLILAVASLAEEVAFRGYPFQRLIDAIGPTLATIVFSLVFAALHMFNPAANRASFMVTVFSSWLLSVAYLRTKALWVCWGWHFAWNASMCLLFGLPVSGITQFSPVIQSDTVGPAWMTGGDYGPEGSVVTAVVILIGIFVVIPGDPRFGISSCSARHRGRRHPHRPRCHEQLSGSASSGRLPSPPRPGARWSRSTVPQSAAGASRAIFLAVPASATRRLRAARLVRIALICCPETFLALRMKGYLQITCQWDHYWRHEGIAMVGIPTKEFFPAG